MGNHKKNSTLSKLAELVEMYLIKGGDPTLVHKIIDNVTGLQGK